MYAGRNRHLCARDFKLKKINKRRTILVARMFLFCLDNECSLSVSWSFIFIPTVIIYLADKWARNFILRSHFIVNDGNNDVSEEIFSSSCRIFAPSVFPERTKYTARSLCRFKDAKKRIFNIIILAFTSKTINKYKLKFSPFSARVFYVFIIGTVYVLKSNRCKQFWLRYVLSYFIYSPSSSVVTFSSV